MIQLPEDTTDPVASPPGTETLSSMAGGRKHSKVLSDIQANLRHLAVNLLVVQEETPAGAVDGVNVTYTLSDVPVMLFLYLNGLRQRSGAGNDYTISGTTITMAFPLTVGDQLLATYFT